ncbi:DNA-binding protein [Vibrio sp. MACH09]|uniref:TIGR02647 family protein n=1 Tax=unclassified Vibrio TaxID=2614977 RepID=UPI001493614B|nr:MULTISPECIES: TIGR02647 family protein [unclassified Vibrio]NOI68038.1 TIGR02647 family protein [Vibrio sp. 99-8-1]GLO61199.1 DNA-binding protein [Vibrio sp. MACH09]
MKYSQENIAELNLLLQFDISSSATGIKVHQEAAAEMKSAVASLYSKGLCTMPDGGYLTDEGIEMAELADKLLRVISA